jgi:ubiquinone/menaquinone biosynthesis C-methylase UbiE
MATTTEPGESKWATDPEYLRFQYGDAEKLRIRLEAHARYSERPNDAFFPWVVDWLGVQPGQLVADVGCGPGAYHPIVTARGARVVAVDFSAGMLAEVRAQAAALALPVRTLRGDAQRLPLASASVDHLMANHMLYHVPDQRRALAEMRRVVKPGGRIVLAAPAASSSVRLAEVHEAAAREAGYTPLKSPGARFTLDDLPLVQSVFPDAQRHVLANAFRFPTVDAFMGYYASGMGDRVEELDAQRSHRARLFPLVEAKVRAIIAAEGVFRDPKDAGCFVATV